MNWSQPIADYLALKESEVEKVGGLLSTLGSSIQSAIEREIARTFDNVDYCERYDGNDRSVLYLEHDPIVSLTSVSLFGNPLTVETSTAFDPAAPPTYPPAQCVIRNGAQALRLTDGTVFSCGRQNVIVVYKAGLTDATGAPPAALVQAGVYWAGLLFKERNRLGISTETVNQQIASFSNEVPADVDRMITAWRRVWLPC